MSFNIFENYFPALSDIPAETVQDARQRIDAYTKAGWPELDTRPNTPFGDFHLTPFAYLVAGLEMALERFRSDLTMENVANGVVYDCDFVRKFLDNFSVSEVSSTGATGIIRMTFNEDKEYTLHKGFQFSIGDYIFEPYAPNSGHTVIRRVGDMKRIGYNDVILIDMGDGTYVADVPVMGASEGVAEGSAATVSETILELVSATALYDFQSGVETTSLPYLASKTRKTIHAASNGTPGGILRFMELEFPGLVASSVVTSGDLEMMRDNTNTFSLSDGRVDILARSAGYGFNARQTVRLYFDNTAQRYMGKISTPEPIHLLNAIYGADGTTEVQHTNYSIFSRSTDGIRAELASSSYSELEELFLVIEMPTDSAGVPQLEIGFTAGGDEYIDVVLDYRCDPLLPSISNTMSGREHKIMGVDTLVKGFVPVIFKKFNVVYTRKPGSTVKIDLARSEVMSYVNAVGYPDTFSESRVNDGVFLAGAHDVVDIEVLAQVKWSVADYFLASDDPSPMEDYEAAVAAARQAPDVTFPSLKALRASYTDPYIGTSDETKVSLGPRNMTFILDSDKLTFTEQFNR